MIHGVVEGEIWSTIKVGSLVGRSLLLVRPDGPTNHRPDLETFAEIVAVDCVGAGVGDRVIVALGRAARNALGDEHSACEAAIVGVVDGLRRASEPPSDDDPPSPKKTSSRKKSAPKKAAAKKVKPSTKKKRGPRASESTGDLFDNPGQRESDEDMPDFDIDEAVDDESGS
ncbi:MAG: EutN/CcmL family microcompartment protein [Planctomycetes bacterium]|nr:EutN/CcmL family microcompartment protein [Planctomycetota bacterium]